jgi:hypothetical protein
MARLSVLRQSLLLFVVSSIFTAPYAHAQSRRIRMRAALAAAIAAAFALALTVAANATTTIIVNSLNDPGVSDTCTLRDAINKAQGVSVAGSTCNRTVDTSYRIVFKRGLTGTIILTSTLPTITGHLTITGPNRPPGITVSGGGYPANFQVMQVASGATLNLNNLTITEGDGSANVNAGGANIYNDGTLTVTHSIISYGNGVYDGGGIYNNGKLKITRSKVSGNNSVSHGGGIYNDGTLTVTQCTFSDNSSAAGGGIYNTGTSTVAQSTFSSNGAAVLGGGTGGGIYNGGKLTVNNSTFYENSASSMEGGFGGGIFNEGTLNAAFDTFYSNSTEGAVRGGAGAGIYNCAAAIFGSDCSNAGSASLKSTILELNTTSQSGNHISDNCYGPITDAGYNISDDATCNFTATGSLNNTDPQLSSAGLANNGGPTQTIALSSRSPAINAIPLADCTSQLGKRITVDQRGFPRPDAGESVCDIGAYESDEFPQVTGP